MSADPAAPVIVGLAESVRRPDDAVPLAELADPASMAADVFAAAAEDSGAGRSLLDRVDLIAAVPSVAWLDGNPARRISELLGVSAQTMRSSLQGGNGPQLLVNVVGEKIRRGEVEVALVGGAEAVQTSARALREGAAPAWPDPDIEAEPDHAIGGEGAANTTAEHQVGLIAPIMAYPLIENALRRAAGRSNGEQLELIAGLWSRFSEVAASRECAWSPRACSPDELATAGPGNRVVTFPYRKLMNANIQVDQAAGLAICSAAAADRLGIPAERRIYLHAGAHGTDQWFMSERRDLARSPAIAACGKAAFVQAGIEPGELGPVDLYSCFPAAVELAAAELGLPVDDPARPLTETGGLTFFGGPGNNYASHGIVAVARALREAEPGSCGLATALGWYATKHALGVYGNEPPERPFEAIDVQAQIDRDADPREVAEPFDGAATAETCTVVYDRDGSPSYGILFALDDEGRRVLCKSDEPKTMEAMPADDFLGSAVAVRADRTFTL